MTRLAALALVVLATAGCTPRAWIDLYFGEHADAADAVAWCESRHQWDARSPGGGNHGLFQINTVHRASFERVTGQPWSAVYGPHNVQFARWLFDQQGWRPWSCQP